MNADFVDTPPPRNSRATQNWPKTVEFFSSQSGLQPGRADPRCNQTHPPILKNQTTHPIITQECMVQTPNKGS